MKLTYHEDDLQIAVVAYLTFRRDMMHDLLFCHIPNMAKRGPKLAAWYKKMGLVAGAPDLIVWTRSPRILDIELKVAKGAPTNTQKAFGESLEALGHNYHVVAALTPADAVGQVERLLDA